MADVPLSHREAVLTAHSMMLWMVVRALAASHPDLGSVLRELRRLEALEDAHGVYSQLPDQAVQSAHRELQETVALLEQLHKSRSQDQS